MLSLTFAPHWVLLFLARFSFFPFSASAHYLVFSRLRSTILQQQFNRVGRVEHGSVALPGIIRSGSIGGPDTYNVGTMPSAQQQVTTGQMHRGHMPPLVRTGIFSPTQIWFHSLSPFNLFFKRKKKLQWVNVHFYLLCISVMLLSTESGPAGPDGDHQQQHAGCPAGSGWPGICG